MWTSPSAFRLFFQLPRDSFLWECPVLWWQSWCPRVFLEGAGSQCSGNSYPWEEWRELRFANVWRAPAGSCWCSNMLNVKRLFFFFVLPITLYLQEKELSFHDEKKIYFIWRLFFFKKKFNRLIIKPFQAACQLLWTIICWCCECCGCTLKVCSLMPVIMLHCSSPIIDIRMWARKSWVFGSLVLWVENYD